MILYHGSSVEVPMPDILHSRSNVDFGRGFYTTPIYDQARKWEEKFSRRGKRAVVSRYRFDETALKSETALVLILTARNGFPLSSPAAADRIGAAMKLLWAVLPMTRFSTPWSCILTA